MTERRRRVLIDVAAGAIISIVLLAILVTNLLDARQKSKQKKAVDEIRAVGMAWFSWLTDQVDSEPLETADESSPAGESRGSDADPSMLNGSASALDIEKMLPDKDPWGNPYEYTHADSPSAESVIQIRCFGRDGKEGGTGFDADIVWADGFFVTYPAPARVD